MIQIRKLYKSYDNEKIYEDFNIQFKTQGISALIGPSGGGKTTLLKILAGIESYEKGSVEGIDYHRLSVVFQENRLIPWLNVEDNLRFVLKSKEDKRDCIEEEIKEILDFLKLESCKKYTLDQLSGGMKRRVSIGRALIYEYDYLLMDEPFKGLDDHLKKEIMQTLKQRWHKNKKTVIFITHNIDEAKYLADDIYILEGRPIQCRKIFPGT